MNYIPHFVLIKSVQGTKSYDSRLVQFYEFYSTSYFVLRVDDLWKIETS